MSSTSPESVTETTHVAGNDESAEKYLDGMSSDAEGFEAESLEAKQAKAEALRHARAARAARAKYARLVSPQTGVPNRNPHNKMQAESSSDMVAAQGDRIGSAEASLAATRVLDQLGSSFLKDREMHPAIKAGVTGLTSYAPLLLLRPEKRGSGVAGFVADPRVWSFGAIALVALGDTFGGKIGEIFDTNRRLKSDGEQVKDKVTEISDRYADLERQFTEFRQNAAVPVTTQKTSS